MIEPRFTFRFWDVERKEMYFTPYRILYPGDDLRVELGFDDEHVRPAGSIEQYKNEKNHLGHKYEIVIMPCTGIKDRLGNLVYEGDMCTLEHPMEIECYDDFNLETVEWSVYGGFDISRKAYYADDEYVVVGNIFQPPKMSRRTYLTKDQKHDVLLNTQRKRKGENVK